MPAELGTGQCVQRTAQGMEALTQSVKKALKRPERLAYLTVSEIACWLRVFDKQTALRVLEPVILPLLAGQPLRSSLRPGQKAALAAGLASGGVAAYEQVRVPTQSSGLGVAAVVGEHAGFVTRLVDKRAAVNARDAALGGVLVAAGVGLAAWKNRKLIPAVALGGSAAVSTAALADDERFRHSTTAEGGIGHGANLMLAGEGLRLVRNTLLKDKKHNFWIGMLEGVTLGATSVGAMLLVDGLTQ
ncbi:hypothetical protein [Corynebacterium cystitidis]|uniref:hypothetical protein n=1 Tax=Corynebacterium cystitidis TaxID=35757 RepID=UPI00211EBFA4|nr:hypothetical protein [Corynebacterium cystitidis]